MRAGRAATMFWLALPVLVGAQPVPDGPEFRVNTYLRGYQSQPSVCRSPGGDFVVVWKNREGSWDVFGQRYDSTGARQGGEFRVNAYTPGAQLRPAVSCDAAGNFVVVWVADDGGPPYATSAGVFGRRFDRTGTPLGDDFRVNTYTTESQDYPAVAADAAGGFLVVWESRGQDGSGDGIFAQRYSSTGAPEGGEFQVNTYTYALQRHPAVASAAAGDFVVVWESYCFRCHPEPFPCPPCVDQGIVGQRYDRTGAPRGGEFQVKPDAGRGPVVAAGANGDFVVVWTSGTRAFGQRYDNAGAAQGGEFKVGTSTFQFDPAVAADADGNFVVVWLGGPPDVDVFGQAFDSAGAPRGGEFRVNASTAGAQYAQHVAADAAGNFVVTWACCYPNFDVFGQRFRRARGGGHREASE